MNRALWIVVLLAGCSEYQLEGQSPDEPQPLDLLNTGAVGDVLPPAEAVQLGVGAVSGLICGPDEEPVIGAVVWIQAGDTRYETVTDGAGEFVLEEVPAGIHDVIAEKGSYQTTFTVQIEPGVLVELAQEECLNGDIDIGVVSGEFDAIEGVLDEMGLAYTVFPGLRDTATTALLRDPVALAEYEVLMINCDWGLEWGGYRHEITTNLEEYVYNGGSLYVSDWSFFVVESTFPDMIDFVGNDHDSFEAVVGPAGGFHAQILDPVFATALGKTETEIDFDQSGWVVAEAVGSGEVLIEAEVTVETWTDGEVTLTSPLLVRLEHGDGDVFYTSFHNEAQVSDDVATLLKQIVENL